MRPGYNTKKCREFSGERMNNEYIHEKQQEEWNEDGKIKQAEEQATQQAWYVLGWLRPNLGAAT